MMDNLDRNPSICLDTLLSKLILGNPGHIFQRFKPLIVLDVWLYSPEKERAVFRSQTGEI